jgi:hypothetical protein
MSPSEASGKVGTPQDVSWWVERLKQQEALTDAQFQRAEAAERRCEELEGDAAQTDEVLRVFRELAAGVNDRFFWMLSPDKRGNHTVSHESVRAVVELCEEIEGATPDYAALAARQASAKGGVG